MYIANIDLEIIKQLRFRYFIHSVVGLNTYFKYTKMGVGM